MPSLSHSSCVSHSQAKVGGRPPMAIHWISCKVCSVYVCVESGFNLEQDGPGTRIGSKSYDATMRSRFSKQNQNMAILLLRGCLLCYYSWQASYVTARCLYDAADREMVPELVKFTWRYPSLCSRPLIGDDGGVAQAKIGTISIFSEHFPPTGPVNLPSFLAEQSRSVFPDSLAKNI